jgi:hypothetical protein
MEYANGQSWRNYFKKEISPLNITCFDPYEKPYDSHILGVDESDTIRDDCRKRIEEGDYDYVAKLFKNVRNLDLALCDKSDFIVMCLNPNVPTIGTIEELSVSVKMKKPVFMFVEGGKKKVPLWILGMIPHEFIFDTLDEVIQKLKDMDEGKVKIDPKYWRLLRKEYR